MMKRKRLHNLLLLLITLLAVLILGRSGHSPYLPIYIVFIACFFYLGWAFVYHKIDKSLTLGIYLEYVLTAALVLILLTGVLF